MKILAMDLGKSKAVGCVYDTETHKHRFDNVPLDRRTLSDVLEIEQPDRVVIEAGWIGDLIRHAGIELQVANPNHEGCVAGGTSNARPIVSMRSSWRSCLPAMLRLPFCEEETVDVEPIVRVHALVVTFSIAHYVGVRLARMIPFNT